MIVKLQSGLVITKDRARPVCDKPYLTNKRNAQKEEEIKVWQHRVLLNVVQTFSKFSIECLYFF